MRLVVPSLACALILGCSSDADAPKDGGPPPAETREQERALRDAHEHFLGMEFDGRWGWYRREVQGGEGEAGWAEWLAEREESEFLEWLALCRTGHWSTYGGALVANDDPRWLRAAAWALDAADPADARAARQALAAHPGLALDWFDVHVALLNPTQVAAHAELVAAAPEREDASAYAPPLGEADVYAGLFREARHAREGTATAARTEEEPARGDAVRGILALRNTAWRPDPALDALADVAAHPDATLAMAVANIARGLEDEQVPTLQLLTVVRDDERPPALREAALDAVAAGPRYAAYVEFCKLALSPRDPMWSAAVRHLRDFGDAFAASCLRDLGDEELDDDQRALRDAALAAIDGRGPLSDEDFLAQLEGFMERLTYADLAGGGVRDKALAELSLELCERLHSYELKYQLKEIMVQYEPPTRLPLRLDGELWSARLREHCADAISC